MARIAEAVKEVGIEQPHLEEKSQNMIKLSFPAINLRPTTCRLAPGLWKDDVSLLEALMLEDAFTQSPFTMYRSDLEIKFLQLRPRHVDREAFGLRPTLSAIYQREDLTFLRDDLLAAKFAVVKANVIKFVAICRNEHTPRLGALSPVLLDAIISQVMEKSFALDIAAEEVEEINVDGTSIHINYRQEALKNGWEGTVSVARRVLQHTILRSPQWRSATI